MLNHENIVKDPQRISKIKPLVNNYNWKEIRFLSHIKEWIKFEANNKSIVLNVLFIENDKKELKQAYIGKHKLKLKNQEFILMITDGEK